MKKKIGIFGMMLTLVFGMSMGVCAAETPTATFDGSEEIQYNYDDLENFGTAFENMLPGDERTQEIILRNTYDRAVDFFMEVEVIQELEKTRQETSGAGYDFSLTVTQEGVNDGNPQMIYGGAKEEDAWIGGDKEGLADINTVLDQYGEKGIKVATLAKDEEAVIALNVSLDGQTGGNSYQDVQGTFQFKFHVSYDDPEEVVREVKGEDQIVTEQVKGDDRVVTRTVKEADKTIIQRVKTGDTTVILPLVALMGLCVLIIAVVIGTRKKDRQN